ncbi:MAG TPA: glycosyltransferase [Bacteroidales bacterium]|nr:glycosyltransferase [Bacteroidales bacterium]
MGKADATLIISVYTNTVALKAVLDSLKGQTYQSFDIVISEDGESTVMKEFLSTYPFIHSWQHLTQPDIGWRKNQALNRAILASRSNYFVLIDGDCVLHPRFMEMHLRYAHADRILAGKRIKLNEAFSQDLLQQKINADGIQGYLYHHFLDLRKSGFRFHEEGFFIDPDHILGFVPRFRKMKQLKGCNMSFSRSAIYAINGFDEDYIQPAIGEDIDLTWRFEQAGYRLFSLRNLAVQYHLHHKENWTDQSENIQLMKLKQESNQFICQNGIVKH